MELTPEEQEAYNAYLLNECSEEQREALDERLLENPDLFEAVCSLEEEWIDRYVRGELSPEQRSAVERSILSSEAGRARVDRAQALHQALGREKAAAEAGSFSRGWFGGLALAFAALAVVALWLGQGREGDAAARPAGGVTAPVYSVRLEAGRMRGDTAPVVVALPPGTRELRLDLVLPPNTAAEGLSVELGTAETDRAWSGRAEVVPGTPSVARAVLPASVITGDDYALRLSSASRGVIATYFFRAGAR